MSHSGNTLGPSSNSDLGRPLTLIEAAEYALALAKQGGADQAEAALHQGTGLSISARQAELETVEKHNDGQLVVTVYNDHKTGSASSADLTKEGIASTVEAALSIARFTGRDECLGLADAARMATQLYDLQQDHPWDLSVQEFGELALECEAAALQQDPRIVNSEGASVSSYRGSGVYANSHGFLSVGHGSQHSLSCSVIAADEHGMQRDYWYDSNRHPANLAAAQMIGQRAGERAVARLGSRKIASTVAPVLFDPTMSKSLISHFLNALKGGAIYKKASYMLDKIDQTVFPSFFSLTENPHLLGGNNSALHDAEGVATVATRALVTDGVLNSYVLSSYTARKLGTQTTANAGGVRNVRLTNTGQSFAQLLTELNTGLLVTELIGSSINSVTGDYSRGAAGFWVENGMIAFPVEEITIAGNLSKMFQNIVAIGNDTDQRGNIHCGSIMLESMTIAGS